MNLLNILYDTPLPKMTILQRKQIITKPHTIVSGVKQSGKTYLIYDYLSSFDEETYLYIDFDDLRQHNVNIETLLIDFLQKNKIKILALDNFKFNFDLSKFISLQSIIISTNDTTMHLNSFTTLNLYPLDFEEYILFDSKHQNTTNSFNSFLKYGNLAHNINISESNQLKENQNTIRLLTNNELELNILNLFIKSSGELKSIFQLFNTFKSSHKISKDQFYKIAKYFELNNIIFYCQKFNQPKTVKKLYCYNHGLIDAVSYNKNFQNTFSNMVYLELITKYQEIYYLDNIDFYIPFDNSIIITIPFFTDFVSLSSKIIPSIIELKIRKITIITISTEKTIFIEDIQCDILPFYEWSLSL